LPVALPTRRSAVNVKALTGSPPSMSGKMIEEFWLPTASVMEI
jgi:hypothetical protein